MTIRRTAPHIRSRGRCRHEESDIQRMCVRWFRLQYPEYARLLFAVPNGGSRNLLEAARMKEEGVTAGVADLILFVPSGEYASLCIEMKTAKGRQRDTQKEWENAATSVGNRYVICRSFDEFQTEVNQYLNI